MYTMIVKRVGGFIAEQYITNPEFRKATNKFVTKQVPEMLAGAKDSMDKIIASRYRVNFECPLCEITVEPA